MHHARILSVPYGAKTAGMRKMPEPIMQPTVMDQHRQNPMLGAIAPWAFDIRIALFLVFLMLGR
jgi:hypothetical protein